MRVEIDAARLLALEVAAKKGRGESARESVLMAKIYATEMAVRVCDAAMRKKGNAQQAAVDAAANAFGALEQHLGLGFQDAREVLLRIRDRRAAARGVSGEWVEQRIVDRTNARAANGSSPRRLMRCRPSTVKDSGGSAFCHSLR